MHTKISYFTSWLGKKNAIRRKREKNGLLRKREESQWRSRRRQMLRLGEEERRGRPFCLSYHQHNKHLQSVQPPGSVYTLLHREQREKKEVRKEKKL